jgi:hypothetical protein
MFSAFYTLSKAEDTLLRRTVALKFLTAPAASDEHTQARFLQ